MECVDRLGDGFGDHLLVLWAVARFGPVPWLLNELIDFDDLSASFGDPLLEDLVCVSFALGVGWGRGQPQPASVSARRSSGAPNDVLRIPIGGGQVPRQAMQLPRQRAVAPNGGALMRCGDAFSDVRGTVPGWGSAADQLWCAWRGFPTWTDITEYHFDSDLSARVLSLWALSRFGAAVRDPARLIAGDLGDCQADSVLDDLVRASFVFGAAWAEAMAPSPTREARAHSRGLA
jgi:hypothetical protein